MGKLPEYIGVSAFGIKMGVIVPGSDVVSLVYDSLVKCNQDGLLHDGDTVCVTESIVARAQNNYITAQDIAREVTDKLKINSRSKIGILFPILSRNRFAMVLKGIAGSVPEGKVVIQLSHPADEVGNQVLHHDFAESIGKCDTDVITLDEIGPDRFKHPITKVDYVELYREIVTEQGGAAEIIFSNDSAKIAEYDLDGIIIANIHQRARTYRKIKAAGHNCITLQQICNSGEAWSEWGVLGSNISSGDKLKLAPRHADEVAEKIQAKVKAGLGINVEVIIYGDGAYRDPSTGIYELADPQPAFGMTKGLAGKYRQGLKYKYMVDVLYDEGIDIDEIENSIEAKKGETFAADCFETEGTTPRKAEDLMASLADLISGSADAGTPLVLVKGFLA